MAPSPSPSLAAPGSSSYSSNTLHVGDGTWDASTDTFLLPNVEGLNFATMRYNGMGNRFRTLTEYHTLVTAHGTIAAITFLGIVPAAILIASFYHRNPRLALRIHISLQVLTVLLTTVIFVLGYFAVGPERSLTNPHHGIGLAIYLLILFQAIGGWIIKKIEKGKMRYHIPIKLMLHQWLGRAIALLAIAQIPIGLTLYGSPVALFVLYSIAVFILLTTYFVLTYRNHVRVAGGYDERDSYVTGTQSNYTDVGPAHAQQGRHRRLEEAAGAVGLGAALAALRRRRSSGRQERYDSRPDLSTRHDGHRPAPSESIVDDKFTESDHVSRQHTWRDRVLGGAAGLGGLAVARKLFKRRRDEEEDEEDDTYAGPYRPPPGDQFTQSQMHLNRMEEGYPGGAPYPPVGGPPPGPGMPPTGVTLADGPGNQHASNDWARVERQEAAQQAAMSRGDLQSRVSEDSYAARDAGQKRPFFSRLSSVPASVAAAGGIGGYWRKRRDRKERNEVDAQRRQEAENERIFRAAHAPYSDDSPQRPPYRGRVGSNSPLTERTGSPSRSRRPSNNNDNSLFPPQPRGGQFGSSSQIHQNQPLTNIPPPPRSTRMAPPPPAHRSNSYSTTASEAFSSPTRARRTQQQQQQYVPTTPPPPRGKIVNSSESPISPPPAAADASTSLLSPPPRAGGMRSTSASPHTNVESPPVSVKVKMHDDGRHVTLRRLNEEEAARERATRRQQQATFPQSQAGASVSPTSDNAASSNRFRRQQTPLPSKGATLTTSPLSGAAMGGSTAGSAAYDTGTGTDITDFDSNRRRRRAERARAEQARAARSAGRGGTSQHVEFT